MDSSKPKIGSMVQVKYMDVGATYKVNNQDMIFISKNQPGITRNEPYFNLEFQLPGKSTDNKFELRNQDWDNEFKLVAYPSLTTESPASGGKRLSRRKRKNNKSRKGRRKSYRRRR